MVFIKTQQITIIPPNSVSLEIASLRNSQTQIGPKENSRSINKVTSEADIDLVPKMKAAFTNPDKTPPQKMQ